MHDIRKGTEKRKTEKKIVVLSVFVVSPTYIVMKVKRLKWDEPFSPYAFKCQEITKLKRLCENFIPNVVTQTYVILYPLLPSS